MNIEKKFQQLVAETTNFKSNKYVSKNIDNHSALDKFYKDKLELSPFRRRNGQILLKHLGTMLKLSNQENIEWLGYKAIYSQKKFMETLCYMALFQTQALNPRHLPVVLSGGVFLNRFLLSGVTELLARHSFKVYTHHKVSPTDEGLALGQAFIALYTSSTTRKEV